MSTNNETILKDTCYYLTPEYAKSFWGKYVWLYQKKGSLLLSLDSLTFSNKSFSISILLKNIISIETKAFSRAAKPFGLASIIIKYVESENEKAIHLVPVKSDFKTTWETNKLITNWVERLEQIPELSGRIKRPLQIPPPPSKFQMAILKSIVVLYFLFVLLFPGALWLLFNRDSFETPVLTEQMSIQDSSSLVVKTLLSKSDFPNNWEWANISTQQPNYPWADTTVDSAVVSLDAKVPQFFVFKSYVRITQWTSLYDSPITEAEFGKLIPVQGTDKTSFTPDINKVGKYIYASCEGTNFYACDVSVSYEYVIYSFMTITPKSFGKQFTTELLNSIINITDQRVRKYFP